MSTERFSTVTNLASSATQRARILDQDTLITRRHRGRTKNASGAVGIGQVVGAMRVNERIASAPGLTVFGVENSFTCRLDENQAFEYSGRRIGVSPYFET